MLGDGLFYGSDLTSYLNLAQIEKKMEKFFHMRLITLLFWGN